METCTTVSFSRVGVYYLVLDTLTLECLWHFKVEIGHRPLDKQMRGLKRYSVVTDRWMRVETISTYKIVKKNMKQGKRDF